MAIPIEVTALAEKARAMQAKMDACEADGGHHYKVNGFSLIAHPDVIFNHFPLTADVTFKSYVCSDCGCRVSVDEGRAYMQAKYLNSYEYERKQKREWIIDLYGEDAGRELYPFLFD